MATCRTRPCFLHPECAELDTRPLMYSTDPFFGRNYQIKLWENVPLDYAVRVADEITLACTWFHDKKHVFPGVASAPRFTKEQVEEVIFALQKQLTKEGVSRTVSGMTCSRHGVKHTDYYELAKLPKTRQRALVERVWKIKQEFGEAGGKVQVWHIGDTVDIEAVRPEYVSAEMQEFYLAHADLARNLMAIAVRETPVTGYRIAGVSVIDDRRYIALEAGSENDAHKVYFEVESFMSIATGPYDMGLSFYALTDSSITGSRDFVENDMNKRALFTSVYGQYAGLVVHELPGQPDGWRDQTFRPSPSDYLYDSFWM